MKNLFSKCSSLQELPNISKWNINNVFAISGMFNQCSSLKTLPDISKWDINNNYSIGLLNINGSWSIVPN